MIYPFLYQVLGSTDAADIRKKLKLQSTIHKVWDDWDLQEVQSAEVSALAEKMFPGLEIFRKQIFISRGRESNFHIDRFHAHHLLHRILIPLDAGFRYEWIVNEQKVSYQPRIGEILLFNNMIPHRFVSNQAEPRVREVIYLDLIDPRLLPYLSQFTGNYSRENGELDQRYRNLK